MKVLQANCEGLTVVSQKSPKIDKSIKTVCQYTAASAIVITAIAYSGIWAVLALTGVVLFKMILKAGE